jgi:hypothetical protein
MRFDRLRKFMLAGLCAAGLAAAAAGCGGGEKKLDEPGFAKKADVACQAYANTVKPFADAGITKNAPEWAQEQVARKKEIETITSLETDDKTKSQVAPFIAQLQRLEAAEATYNRTLQAEKAAYDRNDTKQVQTLTTAEQTQGLAVLHADDPYRNAATHLKGMARCGRQVNAMFQAA